MDFNEQWMEPLWRKCGAVRQKRLADGILIQTCTLRVGHEGDHDPLGGTAVTTSWNADGLVPVADMWPVGAPQPVDAEHSPADFDG